MASRRSPTMSLAAAAALLGGVGLAAPAQAATAPAPAGVPSCVTTEHYEDASGVVAYVWNACGNTQRAQVIVDWGTDSDCFTIPPGTGAAYHYWLGTYNRTESC